MRGRTPAPAPAEVMAIDSPGGRRAEGRIRAHPRQLHRLPRGHPLPGGGGGTAVAPGVAGSRGGGVGWIAGDKLSLLAVTLHLQGRAAAGVPGPTEHRPAPPSPLRPPRRAGSRSLRLRGHAATRGQLSLFVFSPGFLLPPPPRSCFRAKAELGHPHCRGAAMGAKLWCRGRRGWGSPPPAVPVRVQLSSPQRQARPRGAPASPAGLWSRRGGWGRRC